MPRTPGKRPAGALFSLALLLAPLLSAAADWPMFRGNAGRTGYAAEQAAPPLNEAWSFQVPGGIVSSPAVYDGKVYIGSRANRLYAFDARTGALLWSRLTAGWVDSSPYVSSTTVYAACLGGRLYAVDRLSGALRWIVDLGAASASSPLVLGGRVYIGTGSPDNRLRAYDAETGALLAAFQAAQPVDSAPSTDGAYIYFGANDGGVYAVDAVTLSGRGWSPYPTLGSFGRNAVVVSSGALYFLPGRDEKAASSFDPASGAVLASSPELTKTGPWTQAGSPAVDAGGYVYFTAGAADGSEAGAHLAALSSGALSAVWSSSVSLGGVSPIGLLTSPAMANEVIYAATPGGKLIAVSSSGASYGFDMDISSPAYSSPAISNGMVIVANYGGKVFGFRADSHAAISAPRSGDVLSGTVSVAGWFDSPYLAGYELEYSTGGDAPQWVRISSAASSAAAEGAALAGWDVSGLENGEYSLRLRVLETAASGYDSSASVLVRVNSVPEPPYGLAAADVPSDGGNNISLSWSASPSAGVSSYRVYRDGGAGFALLASTPSLAYVDAAALTGSTYAYAVTAWDGWLESARSDEAYAFSVNDSGDSVPPAAVADLSAETGSSGGRVYLSWTAPGDDGDLGEAAYYLVRYSTDPAQDWGEFSSLAGSSRTVDGPAGITESDEYGGLFAGVTYYFTLKGVDDAGNVAGISNTASAWAAFDAVPPQAPSGLAVSDAPGDEGGNLDLVWSLSPDDGAGAGDVYGYRVFRRTLNSSYVSTSPYASVGAGISSYRDTAATINVRYYYSVAAFDSTSDSLMSAEASGVSSDNWRLVDSSNGGVVRLPDGMEVVVPAAAASQNDKIMITRLDPATYEPLSAVRGAAAANPTDIVYQVRFQNPATVLSAPATISLPYTDADVEGMVLENLRVYTLAGGEWVMLNTSSLDEASKKISAEVSHFSIFRVMEYVPAGAVITAAEVYTYPNPARGETLTFKFKPAYKAHAAIDVYNVAGEKVARFERADCQAGIASEIEWRIGGVASGIYVYRAVFSTSAGSATVTKKLAIIH